MIASTCLFNICSFFEKGERTESVHFPIICELGKSAHSIEASNLNANDQPNAGQTFSRFKLNEEKKKHFSISIS